MNALRPRAPAAGPRPHDVSPQPRTLEPRWSRRHSRRDEFVEPYFRRARPDQVVVILKAREPARILIAIGNKRDNRWHLRFVQRWVGQYTFYVNDRHWGRMFVRVCPYFPFSARVYLTLVQITRTEEGGDG
jgi:hypothetical protein